MCFRISLRFGNYALLCHFVGVLELEDEFGARLGEDGRVKRKISRGRTKEKSLREAKSRKEVKKSTPGSSPRRSSSSHLTELGAQGTKVLRIDPIGVDIDPKRVERA